MDHDEMVRDLAQKVADFIEVASVPVTHFVREKFEHTPVEFQIMVVQDLSMVVMMAAHSYFHNFTEGAKPEVTCEELLDATNKIIEEKSKEQKNIVAQLFAALMSGDKKRMEQAVRDNTTDTNAEVAKIREVLGWPEAK